MNKELGPSFLVIADVHGERELAAKALNLAETFAATPVFLGDVINRGPDSKGTVELIKSLGDKAITIAGNHEWVTRNALFDPDNEASALTRDLIWRDDRSMLESYGIKSEGKTTDAIRLRQAMEEAGHWQWLEELPPYFEVEHQFIALHSGPFLDRPWQEQKRELNSQAEPITRLGEEPMQIVDNAHLLSGPADTPEEVDDRIFITGHKHLNLPVKDRIAAGRICLGSNVNAGAPLLAWESIIGAIHEIPHGPNKSQMWVPHMRRPISLPKWTSLGYAA